MGVTNYLLTGMILQVYPLWGFPSIKGGMTIPKIRTWLTVAFMKKQPRSQPKTHSVQKTSTFFMEIITSLVGGISKNQTILGRGATPKTCLEHKSIPLKTLGFRTTVTVCKAGAWKTAVATLISINLKPPKPAIQLPKKIVHSYVFQVCFRTNASVLAMSRVWKQRLPPEFNASTRPFPANGGNSPKKLMNSYQNPLLVLMNSYQNPLLVVMNCNQHLFLRLQTFQFLTFLKWRHAHFSFGGLGVCSQGVCWA